MRPDPGVIFVLFIVAVIGLTVVAYGVLLFARWQSNRIRYVASPRLRSYPLRSAEHQRSARFEPEPEPENLPNPALERQNLERTGAFALNPEECAAVARMIEHKVTAEKPTKASIVWAGFGLKKGSSAKYQRASEIYDTLFVIPPPEDSYPTLRAQQRPSIVEIN